MSLSKTFNWDHQSGHNTAQQNTTKHTTQHNTQHNTTPYNTTKAHAITPYLLKLASLHTTPTKTN